jgi:hypothetical protein
MKNYNSKISEEDWDELEETICRDKQLYTKADLDKYADVLDKVNHILSQYPLAYGINGRMNVPGIVKMMLAEIERKDELLRDILNSGRCNAWQETDERIGYVDLQVDKSTLEEIKALLENKQ